jgi:hypothetical protein
MATGVTPPVQKSSLFIGSVSGNPQGLLLMTASMAVARSSYPIVEFPTGSSGTLSFWPSRSRKKPSARPSAVGIVRSRTPCPESTAPTGSLKRSLTEVNGYQELVSWISERDLITEMEYEFDEQSMDRAQNVDQLTMKRIATTNPSGTLN